MRMLYLTNVEWGRVMGRHQMMLYQLEKLYDCTVIDVHKVHHKHKQVLKDTPLPKDYRKAYRFPYQYESVLSRWLTRISYKKSIGNINDYDCVWISGPELIDVIPKSYTGKVIYDCLDNQEGFTRKEARKRRIRQAETACIERADVVLATSLELCRRMKALGYEKEVFLIRNAFNGSTQGDIKEAVIKDRYEIGFIGYVGNWVDVALLERSTLKYPSIFYRMVGPYPDTVKTTGNEQMKYWGSREHTELYSCIKDCDCLILPFVINELTKAVDPVKMYEYIAFGKCIIASYYEEMERFEKFVYFYRDEKEYIQLLEKLSKEGFPAKYTRQEQLEFLQENTWKKRCEAVEKILSAFDE